MHSLILRAPFIAMSTQQLLITEIAQQPEPLLREVLHYLSFLKTHATGQAGMPSPAKRSGFGSVPGIVMADDFDAPLPDFADYRP